jgi:putative flippase GtrA/2-polyprenyl-3-methyl-5-hydroxy-6-metoxy-1,4-benzoquinol methylase
VPIAFGDRTSGESKRSTKQVFKDAINLIKLVGYRYSRLIKFILVGGVGNIWHYGLLWVLTEYAGWWYGSSLALAILVAMTSNYFLNHYWSFSDRKDANRNMAVGWLKFCGQSAVGDYGIAYPLTLLLSSVFGVWYMLSSFLASGVAVFFKYMVAKRWIWGGKQKRLAGDADYEWNAFYKGLPWQKRWKRIIASIAKEFAEYPDGDAGSVLDIGAGSSPLGLLINHRDYIAIDPNKAKMEYMQAKNLNKCMFISGTLHDTRIIGGNDYFDTVLFIEVIEHLENIIEAKGTLERIHNLLKPNGKLVVATPNYGGFAGKWMDRLYGIFQKGAYKEEHRLKFDLASLKALCQECGFRYVKSEIPLGADMICLFQKE